MNKKNRENFISEFAMESNLTFNKECRMLNAVEVQRVSLIGAISFDSRKDLSHAAPLR